MTVRVLVVEDEARRPRRTRAYVGRVPGFELAGVARSAQRGGPVPAADAASTWSCSTCTCPTATGSALLQRLRAAGQLCDVIAVTSARDADVVRHAVAQGVVLYLLKPFTFATFRAKLEQYAAYRAQLDGAGPVAQDDVDRLFGSLRTSGPGQLPKGMSAETLRAGHGGAARERRAAVGRRGGRAVGASRVTARRYLEHLADSGQVERRPRYGGSGRPEVEYPAGRLSPASDQASSSPG